MMRLPLIGFLLLTAVAYAKPLPVDPSITEFTLKNGLRCWVKSHKTPPGKVSMMLNVHSGSLNENDDQQGLAHFLEHLAFNGSKHFPAGTLTKSFEKIGVIFGNQLNAYTSFDETVYMLDLPDVKDETLEKGFTCMSDFAYRLSITPEEVRKEAGVILEEMRARDGVGKRINDKRTPILFPKSRMTIRKPIGKKKVVENATRKLIHDYYKKWYRPDVCTLIIVGDVNVDDMKKKAEKWFGDWEKPKAPATMEKPGIQPYSGERAAVITDPEWKTGDVAIYYVRKGMRKPTQASYRAELVQDLANWILTRRLQTMIRKGKAPFQSAGAGSGYWYKGAFMCTANAAGDPKDVTKMLGVLVREIQRARLHGFLEQELKQAVTATISGLEQAVKTEGTRNSRGICRGLNRRVSEGYLDMDAKQTLELVQELVKGITLEEVSAAFSANFTKDNRLVLATLPEPAEGQKAVSEATLLEVVKNVESTKVEKNKAEKELTGLMTAKPKPGTWTKQSEDKELGIFSGTLDNGVRVHFREMDYKKNQVVVNVTVSGGKIMEDAKTLGLTHAASLAFNQPATSVFNSTMIRMYMIGKKIRGGLSVGDDSVTATISGSPEDLEDGFQLAHLMLTDALLESSALDNFKKAFIRNYEAKRTDAGARLWEEFATTLHPDAPWMKPLTPERVKAITVEDAQAWLKKIIAGGTMEVAIVGDLKKDRALTLAATYFGSLPKRPASTAAIDARRKLQGQTKPRRRILDVNSIAKRSVVLTGWRTPGWRKSKEEVRAISLASRILQTRIREEIREKRSLTYSAFVFASASWAYENDSFLGIYFTADPDKAESTMKLAQELAQAFAKNGPTKEELETAKKQMANTLGQRIKEPGFWAGQLADMDYRGLTLDELKAIEKNYAGITLEDVQKAMAKYLVDAGRFEIITKSHGKEPAKTK